MSEMTPGRAAAQWWAQQIGAPVFKMDRDDATGEDRSRADMVSVMMGMLADRHPVGEEQGRRFVDVLAEKIDAQLVRTNRVWLAVDYGPDFMLADAAEAAGVNRSRFPIKSSTTVRHDHVTARLGYGAKSTLVWHAPGWEHPTCGRQRYELVGGDYRPFDEVCTLLRYHADDCGQWIPDPARCVECGNSYTWHHAGEYVGHPWNPAGVS